MGDKGKGRRGRNPDRDRGEKGGRGIVWTTGGTSCSLIRGTVGSPGPSWLWQQEQGLRAFSLLSHALHCHLLESSTLITSRDHPGSGCGRADVPS